MKQKQVIILSEEDLQNYINDLPEEKQFLNEAIEDLAEGIADSYDVQTFNILGENYLKVILYVDDVEYITSGYYLDIDNRLSQFEGSSWRVLENGDVTNGSYFVKSHRVISFYRK
ncbi:hypothetical protein ACL43R_02630 [Lactococcus formosensis]|uniref:hypothetical protein n=1 Tax=Lactococcus formosensis TaxID=1281486 RepID=UPI0039F682B5